MNAVSRDRVKKLRTNKGWTQNQLAKITSLSHRTIQRIEKYGRCSLNSQMALSSAFGIPFLELSSEVITPLGSLNGLITVQDGEGNYISVNTRASEILVLTETQIVGVNCTDIFPPEIANRILQAIADLKCGAKSIEFDCSLTLSAVPQFFRFNLIDSGEDTFLSVIHEISEQKFSEEKTLKSASLLNIMADSLKSGAWEIDIRTNEVYWTKQLLAIHEIDKIPSVAESILFYAPQAQLLIQEAFEKLYNSGLRYDLELPFINAKGQELWVRVIGLAEYYNNEIVKVVGVVQDITDFKKNNNLPLI